MSERLIPEPVGLAPVDNEHNTAFFDQAFAQVKQKPLVAKRKVGFFYDSFNALSAKYITQLREDGIEMDPQTFAYIRPDMSITHVDYYAGKLYQRGEFEHKPSPQVEAKNQHYLETERLTTREILPRMKYQIMEPGFLSEPPVYYRQKNRRTCFLANFNMVYTGITNTMVTEEAVLQAAQKQNLLIVNELGSQPTSLAAYTKENKETMRDISDDVLLATLQTPVFKKQFPDVHQIGIIKMTGADFEDIAALTKTLDAGAQDRGLTMDAYVIPMFASEVTPSGTHNAVLLSTDEETVTVHDPSRSLEGNEHRGYAHKQFSKERFVRLWARKGLQSTYVAVFRPQEQMQLAA